MNKIGKKTYIWQPRILVCVTQLINVTFMLVCYCYTIDRAACPGFCVAKPTDCGVLS